jgi:hypothetical protein
MRGFCAICVDGIEKLKLEIIDDKMVLVCESCREDHPRTGKYDFEERPTPSRLGTDGNRWVMPRGSS